MHALSCQTDELHLHQVVKNTQNFLFIILIVDQPDKSPSLDLKLFRPVGLLPTSYAILVYISY